jgi:hypothetical protein
MNVEANDAVSENWEKLFSRIHQGREEYGSNNVDLRDCKEDLYDFSNAPLMRRMQERLVETLQIATGRVCIDYLTFGNKFFITMNEQQQRSFFHVIFNLSSDGIIVGEETANSTESSAITISTAALLETLPHLHPWVRQLTVSNVALTHQSDVQALSNIILSNGRGVEELQLMSIECPVDDCYKEDSDEPNGFLDPLLYAASVLIDFSISTKTRSVHSSLVSPGALRAMIAEGKNNGSFRLNGLGLTDSHVLVIVDVLSTPGTQLRWLNLESNPGITDQGYGALFNLINRTNPIDYVPRDEWIGEWIGFCVDDKVWEGKLNLVSYMNSEYHRLEYLTNGTFTSEERKWQWLERVADLPITDHWDLRKDGKKLWDAKHINFIWFTLCQNPEMMQT